MLGKLKVKGNIMLLQKLNSLWLELLKSGKAPEFPYIMELMSKTVNSYYLIILSCSFQLYLTISNFIAPLSGPHPWPAQRGDGHRAGATADSPCLPLHGGRLAGRL